MLAALPDVDGRPVRATAPARPAGFAARQFVGRGKGLPGLARSRGGRYRADVMRQSYRQKPLPRPDVLQTAQDRQWAGLRRSIGCDRDGEGGGPGTCGSAVTGLSDAAMVRALTQISPMPARPSATSPNC